MYILPDNEWLTYSGRITVTGESAEFVYPCSSVALRFTGTGIRVRLSNRNAYWDNYLGVILDGEQKKLRLALDGEKQELVLAEGLKQGEHELLLFKRQDSCHVFWIHGFVLDDGGSLCAPQEKPARRIEVYGDSVSAGEVSEAVEYAGKPDPEWHQGELSNSWYSYAWMTARRLNAQIHDIAQGGIALMDGTGWFLEPEQLGMESVYDKAFYHPLLGETRTWDFNRYRPHVVIVAIGQNDNHPEDYMKEDYNSSRSVKWRRHYLRFVRRLRELYPKAEIILMTTILEHDASWDLAIGEVWRELGDEKVHHFLFSENGSGTPGHIRIPEAERMAEELSGFIESLGERIWKDE